MTRKQDINTLWKHLFHLAFLKGFSKLIPLFTIPLLMRTVGLEQFGIIKWIESIGDYLLVFMGYGFRYTATQQVMIYKQNKPVLSQLIGAVYTLKLIAILISGLFVWCLILWVPPLQALQNYLWTYYAVVVVSMLFPCFIFQGLDKMAWMTGINLCSKVIFIGSVLLWVHTPADSLVYHQCLAISYLVRLLVAVYCIYLVWGIRISKPTKAMLRLQLKDGLHIFLGQLTETIYSVLPSTFLGFFAGPLSVATYVIGSKAVHTLISLLEPFQQALYPIAYKVLQENTQSGLRFIFRIILVALVFVGIIGGIYYYFASYIIQLLAGTPMSDAVWVLQWEAWLPCMSLWINLLGVVILVPLQAGYPYTVTMLATGLTCIVLQLILVPTWQIQGAVWAILLTKALATFMMTSLAYRRIKFSQAKL